MALAFGLFFNYSNFESGSLIGTSGWLAIITLPKMRGARQSASLLRTNKKGNYPRKDFDMKSYLNPFSARKKAPGPLSRMFWLGWSVTIISLELLVLWLWLRRRSEPGDSVEAWEHPEILLPEIEAAPLESTVVRKTTESSRTKPAPAKKAERLERIEGIGPKVAGLLNAAGIRTFAQLAEADVEQLRKILKENRLNFINPSTWPEQARLAAGGRWQDLEALQGRLKGGQRID
jgi:predicted flap endonuclease-1-like 5' DNA nuclease